MSTIVPITMPKWGLAMTEGTVTTWWKRAGEVFAEGVDLVDIETSKITNGYEAPFSGRLARIVANEGEAVLVGGLIGVSAPESVSEAEIDRFVADFQANFVPDIIEDAEDAGLQRQMVLVDSASYCVGVTGDLSGGQATVLIHGFSGDLDNWLFNVDAIAEQGPVVSVDLPGHGASDKQLKEGTVAELAYVVRQVLDKLGIKRADVVGHSLGGAVAMRVAIDDPNLVRSIVLLSSAGLPGAVVNNDFIRGVVDAQNGRQLLPALKLLFADPDLATREMADEMMKYKRLDGVDEALAKIADRIDAGDEFAALHAQLASLPRTTVIHGRIDQVVSFPDRGALPAGWRVIEVESGHMPQFEMAEEINGLIAGALAGADA